MKIFPIITALVFACVELLAQGPGDTLPVEQAILQLEHDAWAQGQTGSFPALVIAKARYERQHEQYHRALADLERVKDDTTIPAGYHYERAMNLFLLGQFEQAFYHASKATELRESPSPEMLVLRCLAEIETTRFPEARATLRVLFPGDSALVASSLEAQPLVKDPDKAAQLALFFPGLGQAYAGYPARSLASLALVAACVGTCAAAISCQLYTLAFLAGIYPAAKFYLGGRLLSSSLAERHNKTEITKIQDAHRSFLLSRLAPATQR